MAVSARRAVSTAFCCACVLALPEAEEGEVVSEGLFNLQRRSLD